MEYILYFYNVIITISFALCAIGFFMLYKRNKKTCELWSAILFTVYIIDNCVTYMTESITSFSEFYLIKSGIPSVIYTLISFMIHLCYRMVSGSILEIPMTKKSKTIWSLTLVLLLVLTAFSYIHIFGIVIPGFFRVAVCILFAWDLYILHTKRGSFKNKNYNLLLTLLILSFLFEVTTGVEQLLSYKNIWPVFGNRNISIELLSAVYIAAAVGYIIKHMGPTEQGPTYVGYEYDNELIDKLCEAKGLTKREREIFILMLKGRSNAEISDEIFISIGTVKVHTHNIYGKLGIGQRVQIYDLISRFKSENT